MILVDKRLKDLAIGRDRIRRADRELPGRWRHRLLAGYASRCKSYTVARAAHRQQMAELGPKMLGGIGIAGVVSVGGLLVVRLGASAADQGLGTSCCLGPMLVLAGVIASGVLGIIWLRKAVFAVPKPPQHPLRGPLREKLLQPLMPLWRKGLEEQLPSSLPYEGAVGEHKFVSRLREMWGDPSFILYRLQQRPGEDIDVVVVGPQGVWVFEVKYWSGIIAWRGGQWDRTKSYYAPGGIPVIEGKDIGQPPDRQWRRVAGDVAQTLSRRAVKLVTRLPALANIGGGLVFTHHRGLCVIDRDAPFEWGYIINWVSALEQTPEIPGLSERVALQIVDTLLARHRQVSGGQAVGSMYAFAEQLVQEAEARLAQWVAGKVE